jgi:hypothetical protein
MFVLANKLLKVAMQALILEKIKLNYELPTKLWCTASTNVFESLSLLIQLLVQETFLPITAKQQKAKYLNKLIEPEKYQFYTFYYSRISFTPHKSSCESCGLYHNILLEN